MIEHLRELAGKTVGKIETAVENKREWDSLDPKVQWLVKRHHALRYTPQEIGQWEKWSIGFLSSYQEQDGELINQIITKCSPIKIAAALEMLSLFAGKDQKPLIDSLSRILETNMPSEEKENKEGEHKKSRLKTKNLNVFFGNTKIVEKVNIEIIDHEITALVGPSGSGKSTLIRALNRMHEETKGGRPRVEGEVFLDDINIYDKDVNPGEIRKIIGMVFQKPNPFPTMSIYENVIAGQILNKKLGDPDDIAESALREVGLWGEVKKRLNESGEKLSGGQQQRLCIARAIANNPEILLLDEPCSALDGKSIKKIEKLLKKLKEHYTIIIVTHNIGQAERIAGYTAVMMPESEGNKTSQIIAFGKTDHILKQSKDPRIIEFIEEDQNR